MATSVQTRNLGNRLANAIAVQDAAINSALRESVGGAASFFSTLAAVFAAKRERRAAFQELNTLSDRELADLGIARSDIRNVVSGKIDPRA